MRQLAAVAVALLAMVPGALAQKGSARNISATRWADRLSHIQRLSHVGADPAFAAASDAFMAAHPRTGQGAVSLRGEIAILEGDPDIVSTDGAGFGIRDDGTRHDPANLVARFVQHFGEDFDEIALFTTFDDQGSPGALAYEEPTSQDVQGLGLPLFNDNAAWGAHGTRLHAFLNMKTFSVWERWGAMTDPKNFLYPVWGQESAHRWLSFLKFRKADGTISAAMLGRQNAHWSRLLQTSASVMDGVQYETTEQGTFRVMEAMARYSALDQYAMGLRDASEVPPFFLVEDGTNAATGNVIDPTKGLAVGTEVAGTRINITIEEVVAANGPRNPAPAEAPKVFRMAVILVTQPGQTAADVFPMADTLEQVRKVWEQSFAQFSDGRGQMCTRVTMSCDAPTARVQGTEIRELEGGGNGNGVIEPGEMAQIIVRLKNDGMAPAAGVAAQVTSEATALTIAEPRVSVGEIGFGQTATAAFTAQLEPWIPCGTLVTLHAEATVGGHRFTGSSSFTPGMVDHIWEGFEEDSGWLVNPEGTDTATAGAWDRGAPEATTLNGVTMQPGAAASGQAAFVTGPGAGKQAIDNDVDGGSTTLESPPYSLRGIAQPTLQFRAWHMALDFNAGSITPIPAVGDDLVVYVSTDEQSWKEVGRISDSTYAWAPVTISLKGLEGQPQVRFRFVVGDGGSKQNLVEAGIDDVRIQGATAACAVGLGTPYMPPVPGAGQEPAAGGCEVIATHPALRAGAQQKGAGVPAAGFGASLLGVFLLLRLALRRRRSMQRLLSIVR